MKLRLLSIKSIIKWLPSEASLSYHKHSSSVLSDSLRLQIQGEQTKFLLIYMRYFSNVNYLRTVHKQNVPSKLLDMELGFKLYYKWNKLKGIIVFALQNYL
jgi:hypothetical protein